MAGNLTICDIDEELKERLKAFRFRKEKNTAAIIMKIDTQTMKVVLDEELEDCTMEDLQNELPGHLPRYVAYSHHQKHDDGRESFPLVFIFVSPSGCKPEMQVMYSGSKLSLVAEIKITKVFKVRSTEELTEEWLTEKLKIFK